MTISLETIFQQYPRSYITDNELAVILDSTPDSRYGKVKRWLIQKKNVAYPQRIILPYQ